MQVATVYSHNVGRPEAISILKMRLFNDNMVSFIIGIELKALFPDLICLLEIYSYIFSQVIIAISLASSKILVYIWQLLLGRENSRSLNTYNFHYRLIDDFYAYVVMMFVSAGWLEKRTVAPYTL